MIPLGQRPPLSIRPPGKINTLAPVALAPAGKKTCTVGRDTPRTKSADATSESGIFREFGIGESPYNGSVNGCGGVPALMASLVLFRAAWLLAGMDCGVRRGVQRIR